MAHDIHHELYAILGECWDRLERGARHPESRLHAPVLATTGDGCEPDARTVLIENVDASARRLYLNTDRRSPKFRQLQNHPRALFVFYEEDTQLRLRTDVQLHCGDATAARSWNALPESQRIHYRTTAAPGAPITRGEALHLPEPAHHPDEGKGNYVVVEAHVTQIDWLRIDADGEHRAVFKWDEEGYIVGRWVAP